MIDPILHSSLYALFSMCLCSFYHQRCGAISLPGKFVWPVIFYNQLNMVEVAITSSETRAEEPLCVSPYSLSLPPLPRELVQTSLLEDERCETELGYPVTPHEVIID